MNIQNNCKAILLGQEYHCDHCGVVWDMNDDDEDVCKMQRQAETKTHVKMKYLAEFSHESNSNFNSCVISTNNNPDDQRTLDDIQNKIESIYNLKNVKIIQLLKFGEPRS